MCVQVQLLHSQCSFLHIAITQTRADLSIQFATSIDNVVSQRGLRSASCIVDVDWLKVWVQLVVRERDGDYRDGQLNRVYITLTLRLLMSYIYIYIYIYIYMQHLFLMFLDHIQRRSTVGRTPLDD